MLKYALASNLAYVYVGVVDGLSSVLSSLKLILKWMR